MKSLSFHQNSYIRIQEVIALQETLLKELETTKVTNSSKSRRRKGGIMNDLMSKVEVHDARIENELKITKVFYNPTSHFLGLIFRMTPKASGLIKPTSSECPFICYTMRF